MKKKCVSQKVQEEMVRLRKETLVPCLPCLYNIKEKKMKILFHNVRSLHRHFEDVKCDDNVQTADVNIFVETALCSSDIDAGYQISGFQLFRNDASPESTLRTCYGTAVYIRNDMQCVSEPFRANFNDVEITVSVLSGTVSDFHIVGIYQSKS